MSFAFTKGYLIDDDLPWDVHEFLRGSDNVNDAALAKWTDAQGATHTFALFATSADLVAVRVRSSAREGIVNELAGYASLDGGFSRIAFAGDDIHLLNATRRDIYGLPFSFLNGGDSTPEGWSPQYSILDPNGAYSDIHAQRIDGQDYLYAAALILSQARLMVARLAPFAVHQTGIGESPDCGLFPKGDHGRSMYWHRGGQLYAFHDVPSIANDDFMPTVSYGRIADDFSGGQIDLNKWSVELAGNMNSCFGQQNARLEFDARTVGSGEASSHARYLAACAGNISIQTDFRIDSWPMGSSETECSVGLELRSADDRIRYRSVLDKTGYSLEIREGGVPVQTLEGLLPPGQTVGRIFIARKSAAGTHTISFGYEAADAWIFWQQVIPGNDNTPLMPAIYVTNNSGANGFTGSFADFKTRDADTDLAQTYAKMNDAEILAGGLSPLSADSERTIALVFPDCAQIIATNESSPVGTGEAMQKISASLSTNFDPKLICASPLASAVSGDGRQVFIAGAGGVTQLEIDEAANPAWRRDYTTTYDHAQPLTDTSVISLDATDEGFVYGCETGAYGSGGGCGYLEPDFSAPLGFDAWARARRLNEIAVGANSPDPIPEDYLHAHLERRINEGAWQRLQHDGWTQARAENRDHDSDIAFLHDARLGDMGACVQEEGLADGRYEYRWVFHDEAGNEGFLAATTLYGDDAEYIDTPVIGSIVAAAPDFSSTAASRGIIVVITADSGANSGNAQGKVHQARIWNAGDNEADAPWREFKEGIVYPHLLEPGNGLKTVRARVRSVSGLASAFQSSSIMLSEHGAAAPAGQKENVILCFGGLNGYNFSGDCPGSISSNSENPAFPAGNVRHDDLGLPWHSSYGGPGSNPNRPWGESAPGVGGATISYTAWLKWDLRQPRIIDVFAILAHNFSAMREQAASANGHFSIVLLGSDTNLEFPSDGTLYSVDLSVISERALIAHRPQASRRYWGLRMNLGGLDANAVNGMIGMRPAWSIGRVVLNESGLCWQAPYNYDERIRQTHTDPSRIAQTIGQARRVVEQAPFRKVELRFRDLAPEQVRPVAEVWNRQRQVRPVLALLEPEDIATGTLPPGTEVNTDGVIYGYLGDSMFVDGAGWNHADVRVTITETVG
jgi:hypothetical protein